MAALPRGRGRRVVLGTLALAAVGTPLAIAESWAQAGAKAPPQPGGGSLWRPDVVKDGLKAFEGIEADRGNKHPERRGKYVVVEQDHWRFNIWKDDRDPTGGGNDRQRTEVRGMMTGRQPVKMRNNETWQISYEMFIPASLHGTSHFTHVFQTKTPSTNAGPWVTVSLSRNGKGEQIRLQADSTGGAPVIAAADLASLHERWVSVTLTLRIGQKGSAGMILRNVTNGVGTSSVLCDGTRSNVTIPDQGDYVRPKWGIYRSVQSASADILDTYLLFRNYSATKLG